MATDKELLGVELDYILRDGTCIRGFVAQADPEIGITVDALSEEEKPGSNSHLVCLNKKEWPGGSKAYKSTYSKVKGQVLSGTISVPDAMKEVYGTSVSRGEMPNCAFN